MPIEETTFSEEHLTSPSWKEWGKENKIFLVTIGGLMALSLVLLFQSTSPKSKDIPKPQLQPIVHPQKPLKVIPKIIPPRGPLEIAQHLYQESKIEEALRLLLHTAQTHQEETIREEASELAKRYHGIQTQKTQLQKLYLQGYVLWNTYPKEACQEWAKALMISLKEDPYYQKAQKRWNGDCKNY
ncbi:MAG: hypothetical protein HYW85_02565 [Deltaproteobacteria bacterium]|nr:hypothetical protein [Deltaproteobacteria bacterium]